MQQFELEIKNEKKKSYRLFNWFALIISVAAFLFFLLYGDWFIEALGAIIIVFVYLLTRFYRRKIHKAVYLFDDNGYLFFILAFGWLGLQKYFITALCILFGIIYQMAMQKIIFLFKKEFIVKTNFPKKEIEWSTVQNVILKDHFLTIDFRNNRIIQGEINSSKEINQNSFNRFVEFQIKDHSNDSEFNG